MKYPLTVIAVIAVLGVRLAEVDAEILVGPENVTVQPGESSFFDLFAVVTGPSQNISGWQFEINLDQAAVGQISFTGIGAPTAPHPNVFPGVDPLAILPITSTQVAVTNFPPGVGGFGTLDNQDGFVRVFFDVLPSAQTGTYDVTINPLSAEIVNDNTPVPLPVPFGIRNGVIQTSISPIPTCDFNADTMCDIIDIDMLMNEVGNGTDDLAFDLNGDTVVDDGDRDDWLSLAAAQNSLSASYLLGDSNLDLRVDAADLNALAIAWQSDNNNWSNGNFTGGFVNSGDLNVLALNWQAAIPAASSVDAPVPEPTAWLLTQVGLTLVWRRSRRFRSRNR